jgi:outer membrane receptor for Fe3+-dicitrate
VAENMGIKRDVGRMVSDIRGFHGLNMDFSAFSMQLEDGVFW